MRYARRSSGLCHSGESSPKTSGRLPDSNTDSCKVGFWCSSRPTFLKVSRASESGRGGMARPRLLQKVLDACSDPKIAEYSRSYSPIIPLKDPFKGNLGLHSQVPRTAVGAPGRSDDELQLRPLPRGLARGPRSSTGVPLKGLRGWYRYGFRFRRPKELPSAFWGKIEVSDAI